MVLVIWKMLGEIKLSFLIFIFFFFFGEGTTKFCRAFHMLLYCSQFFIGFPTHLKVKSKVLIVAYEALYDLSPVFSLISFVISLALVHYTPPILISQPSTLTLSKTVHLLFPLHGNLRSLLKCIFHREVFLGHSIQNCSSCHFTPVPYLDLFSSKLSLLCDIYNIIVC